MKTARRLNMMGMMVSGLPLTVLLLIVLMAGCGGGGGGMPDESSTAIPDDPASVPWVSSTGPVNNDTNVPVNVAIAVCFSKRMDPSTITTATFVVTGPGAVPVAGTVAGEFRTATFRPSSDLAPSTKFTATITTGVRDLEGNPQPADVTWEFTTGAGRDNVPPTVVAVTPADSTTYVAGTGSTTAVSGEAMDLAPEQTQTIGSRITAMFSEAMDPTTITRETFTLRQGTTRVPGNVTYSSSSTATFQPRDSLAPDTTFTATVGTGAKDLAGNALQSPRVWSFNTGGLDTTAPTVTSTSPADAARNVPVKTRVTATFSEAMAPRAITTAQFTLRQGPTRVLGNVTYAGLTATFAPLRRLAPCTTYTATITGGAKDMAGNQMASAFVWRFTTGQEPVPLRSATSFAVLADSTVTNTALLTTINGDLGVSPGTAVTGFPPGVVNGAIHAADPIAAQAKLDLTAAYNDAAGRSCRPVTVAGNLGGRTLYPGLYKSTGSLEISSGDLTLDAQGDPNAVFIFQMASTLTTTSGRQVILSGGARANNVYWQVGSSATLGTTSVFKGNILALASITLQTGATLEGRALTQTAAVTLDGNTITRPPW